jgi:AcrR family transcriptional regulator
MPRAGLDAEAVIAGAAALADADGLPALTLARLADRLGVRAPSLYAHVGGGLADVRRRLGARGARELAAAVQVAAAGRSRLDALRAVAHAYRTYAHAHPGIYAAMQRAPEPDDVETGLAARELIGVIVAVLAGYGLQDEEAIHAVRVVRAALHGFVSLEHEGGFRMPISREGSYERLIVTLDAGFAGPSFDPAAG